MVEHDPSAGIALAFDDFGWGELSAEARANRCTEVELVTGAIADYLDQMESGGWSRTGRVPRFAREPARRPQQLDVDLSTEQIKRLREEAERQQVSVPQLVVHAVLLKLGQS